MFLMTSRFLDSRPRDTGAIRTEPWSWTTYLTGQDNETGAKVQGPPAQVGNRSAALGPRRVRFEVGFGRMVACPA